MVFNFYPHLPHDYEKYEDICPPMHQSMRVINKRTKKPIHGWKRHRHFNNDGWNYILKILDNSVGKKFDSVYSDICKKFSKEKDFWLRQKFVSEIDQKGYSRNKYHRSSYYLDNDRVIREYEHNKPSKSKEVITSVLNSNTYYDINKDMFLQYPIILDRIKNKLGNSTLFKVLNFPRLPIKEGKSVQYVVSNSLRDDYGFNKWGSKTLSPDKFICAKTERTCRTCEVGSKECYRFFAEVKDARRKHRRNNRKAREEEASKLLHSIELNRKLSELQLNGVTRDRLGFDEGSFKGEFYHGQKRKKKA